LGGYVLLPGAECYRVVSEAEADTIYTKSKIIWTKGQFGDDRGQLELDDVRVEGSDEQDRNDQEANQDR